MVATVTSVSRPFCFRRTSETRTSTQLVVAVSPLGETSRLSVCPGGRPRHVLHLWTVRFDQRRRVLATGLTRAGGVRPRGTCVRRRRRVRRRLEGCNQRSRGRRGAG